MNQRIRASRIRLIDAEGKQVGVVAVPEGLRLADQAGLDLVEIVPNANPPVCRILDYGKYLYSLEKKAREAKKKQKVFHLKELRVSLKIDEHDYQTKLRKADEFLSRGDKVQFTMRFRGRERAHTELGLRMFQRLQDDLAEVGEVEKPRTRDGNTMTMVLGPKRGK